MARPSAQGIKLTHRGACAGNRKHRERAYDEKRARGGGIHNLFRRKEACVTGRCKFSGGGWFPSRDKNNAGSIYHEHPGIVKRLHMRSG